MAWTKTKRDSGDCYVINSRKKIVHDIQTISIQTLNDDTRDFVFTYNPDYVLETVEAEKTDLPSGQYRIHAESSWDPCFAIPMERSHDQDLLKLSVIKDVLQDFASFKSQQDIYTRLGIVYKRGILLFGPPGTGKTTAINILLNELDAEEHLIFYISDELPNSFVKELKLDPRPKVLVFEELTEHASKDSPRSTAQFLTFLDGENSVSNVYIIATTNYPEKLPGNIVDRPGRFDKLFYISHLPRGDREKYLEHLLGRAPAKDEIDATADYSVAYIKELVLMVLKDGITLDQAVKRIRQHKDLIDKNFEMERRKMGFIDTDNDD